MAELAVDPEYQRQFTAEEAARQPRAQEERRASEPILADLRTVGVDVQSVWDLGNRPVPYPAALPILLKHLEKGGYPDRVMESLGTLLAVPGAAFAWERLRRLFLKAKGRGEEEGLASALAASATHAHLDALISLLGEDSRSDVRIHFLRAIKRVGAARGRAVIEGLRDDPLYGSEARALTKPRKAT